MPYIQTEIKEVKIVEEKVILNNVEVERIIEVPTYIEKIVSETHEIIKTQEVEKRVDNPIEVPKIVTVENIVPVIV